MFTKLIFILIVSIWFVSCSGGGGGLADTSPGNTTTVTKLFLENNWTCAVRSDDSIKCIGNQYSGATNESFFTSTFNNLISSFNENRNCSVSSAGNLLCWGANGNGELGRASTGGTNYTPTNPNGFSGVVVLKVSAHYSVCAIDITGQLICWGKNDFGQVGKGNTTTANYDVPQLITGITASDVAVGPANICAVTTAGIKCTGYNFEGAVGDGTAIDKDVFTTVISLPASPLNIVTDGSTFCGLFTGGKVRCWGKGSAGALGNGGTANASTPVTPTGMDGSVTSLVANPGVGSICALKSNEVYCWGYNGNGTIGDGTQTNRSSPTKITSLGSDNASIYASGEHTCVLKTAGTVYCWGDSAFDEAGKTCSSLPCKQLTPVLMDL